MKCLNLLLSIILILGSCQNDIDFSSIDSSPKIVVYCFPSCSDTVFINVSRSIPIKCQEKGALSVKEVICKIDGVPVNVEYKGIDNSSVPSYIYCAIGKCSKGTSINLTVSAEELPTVDSFTTIPDPPHIISSDMNTVFIKGEWFTQLRLKFESENDETFYAIRVIGNECIGNDSTEFIETIETNGEPLLNNGMNADIGFGTSNSFYHDLYIFDNSQIKGEIYTLHLNVPYKTYVSCYKIQLYKITKDYYRFLKSINDISNNNFNNYGLSLMTPTYSNIVNGIGILGAYNVVETNWIMKKAE